MPQIVNQRGPAAFIEGLAAEIEADYRRWGEFDKSPRHATHSRVARLTPSPSRSATCPGRTPNLSTTSAGP